MIGLIFNRAENAAQEIARDAGLTLLVAALQFGAMLFAFGGLAWALAAFIPTPAALVLTGGALGLTAAAILAVKRRAPNTPVPIADGKAGETDPLAGISRTMNSLGRTLDVVAAGMATRQLKRAPIATIAATVAAGLLIGMLADADDD